jgi:hypothetical protein
MHKTGTSSIQQSFYEFNDGSTTYLSDLGINHSVPIMTIFSNDPYSYHIWNEQGKSHKEIDKKKKEYKDALDNFLKKSKHDKVIISGEDIGFLDEEEKKNLLLYFIKKQFEIKVICLFRDPCSYAASDLQQKIKGGRKKIHMVHPFYLKRLKGFDIESNNVSFVLDDFHRILKEYRSPVRWFAEIVSVDNTKIKEVRANDSLSNQAMKIIYLFNKYGTQSTGTASRYRAKKEFIKIIKEKYEFSKNNDKEDSFFINLLSPKAREEIKILDEEVKKFSKFVFNYSFLENEIELSDILAYLEDRKSINKKPINELLSEYNTKPKDTYLIEKLNSIYEVILKKKDALSQYTNY